MEVIDGVTLTSGEPAKTINDVAVSDGPNGLVLADGRSHTTLRAVPQSTDSVIVPSSIRQAPNGKASSTMQEGGGLPPRTVHANNIMVVLAGVLWAMT